MKLRHPRLIRIVSWLTAGALRPWVATLRADADSGPSGPYPADPSVQRYIYVFWHESLLAAFLYRRYPGHVLISQHADGELIAQACERMGVGVVRGSSRKGGAKALLQMYRLSQTTHLVITPDGPRGPRRRMHQGVVQLASHVGLPILPVGIGFRSAWRANSWDRFAIPRPFSKIFFRAGEPLHMPPHLDECELEAQRLRAERALLDATERAERAAANNSTSAPSSQAATVDESRQGRCDSSQETAPPLAAPHAQRASIELHSPVG